MAWMGLRPLAMSCPPARRAADANGAAHRFSHTTTPATVPGSMAAPKWATSSAASNAASWVCSYPEIIVGVEVRYLDGLD